MKKEETYVNLRAHHLLCSVLYIGEGYSDEFTDNMSGIVNRIRKGCNIRLKKSPDMICKECPNKMDDGGCRLNKENLEIKSLDSMILSHFELDTETVYNSKELFKIIQDSITENDFAIWCADCRWLKAGLCSYDKYMERIGDFSY